MMKESGDVANGRVVGRLTQRPELHRDNAPEPQKNTLEQAANRWVLNY